MHLEGSLNLGLYSLLAICRAETKEDQSMKQSGSARLHCMWTRSGNLLTDRAEDDLGVMLLITSLGLVIKLYFLTAVEKRGHLLCDWSAQLQDWQNYKSFTRKHCSHVCISTVCLVWWSSILTGSCKESHCQLQYSNGNCHCGVRCRKSVSFQLAYVLKRQCFAAIR